MEDTWTTPRRIVIDLLSTIAMRFERPYERRNMLYELFKGISSLRGDDAYSG